MIDGLCPFVEQISGVTTFTRGYMARVGFCDHTAGGFYTTLRRKDFWVDNGHSVHFGIGRKGEACQLVNIFDSAWAQGRDSNGNSVGALSPGITWPPFAQMGKANPNVYLISTEHEDAITVNGQTVFIAGSEWTPEMYAMDLRIKRWCVEEVRRVAKQNLMPFGIDSLAGHHMFDPRNRANCPGRFWRDEYRARLYADLTEEDELAGIARRNGNMIEFTNPDGFVVLRLGNEDGSDGSRLQVPEGDPEAGGRWRTYKKSGAKMPDGSDIIVLE